MTDRLHVAFVMPHFGRGGAENSTRTLAQCLIARGHRVDLLTVGRSTEPAIDLPAGARLLKLEARRRFRPHDRLRLRYAARYDPLTAMLLRASQLDAARSVAKYIRYERPDCILPSLPSAKVTVALGRSLAARGPVVIPIMRNNIMHRRWDQRRLYARLFPQTDRIVAVSDGVAESLVRQLGIDRAQVTRIYNPSLRPGLSERARAAPEHAWLSDLGPPVILSAGRFVPVKDFPVLLRAALRVFRHRAARLIILGDGPQRRTLERQVRQTGMSDRVALPGWQANPFAYMRRAAVFVLSSRLEGFGNVLVEALACGCPCVSTDCDYGPSEILDRGRFGELVPVGDDAALADAIAHVLDAPSRPDALRAAATRFSAEHVTAQYERLIVDTLAARHC